MIEPDQQPSTAAPAVRLRLVLVSDPPESIAGPLLAAAGHAISASINAAQDWVGAVVAVPADAVVLELEQVDHAVAERCAHVMNRHPRPVALFARRGDAAAYRDCVAAGVGAIVIDALEARHLANVLALAVVRFEEWQRAREELAALRARLADRRDIERAKGLLARHSRLSEEEAYAVLRSSAMTQRITIGAAARAVLGADLMLSRGSGDAP